MVKERLKDNDFVLLFGIQEGSKESVHALVGYRARNISRSSSRTEKEKEREQLTAGSDDNFFLDIERPTEVERVRVLFAELLAQGDASFWKAVNASIMSAVFAVDFQRHTSSVCSKVKRASAGRSIIRWKERAGLRSSIFHSSVDGISGEWRRLPAHESLKGAC